MSTEITTAANQTIVDGKVNTLSLDSFEGRKTFVNAVNAAQSLKDVEGVPLVITDILQDEGIRKGRGQGQMDVPCINTYLITVDGQAYFSQSDGIARSARAIARVFPDMNKPDGIEVVVTSTTLTNGNTIKALELV